jgi:hypothetical protein
MSHQCCSFCDYNSSKLFNPTRQMVNKHKETEKSEKDLNVVISDLNVVIEDLNVAILDLNVVIREQNVVSDTSVKCPSCYKVFKTNKSAKRDLIVFKLL